MCECVIWSVALESMTQELTRVVSETFKLMEKGNSTEYAKKQVLGVSSALPRLLMSALHFSISSWLRFLNSFDVDYA